MEAVLTIARNTDHVSCGYPHYAEQVEYLAELGGILHDDTNRLIGACLFLVTPLRMDHRAGALLAELVRRRAPIWIGTQPAAGASSPVTVAGTVVLATAEILAGWVAAYCLDPEAMPGAGICSGTLDMKVADVSYCAPESMLQDLLCVELFRELCGGRVGVAGCADYTDAKWPGAQKAFESAFEALTIWMYTGSLPSAGNGLVESGKTFSPVQFMLDEDMSRYLGRFARGVTFTEEDLAREEVLSIGLGLEANHMSTEHTYRHFRSLMDPRLLDRSCWRGDAAEAGGEEQLRERAWAAFEAVRARYEPVSVGEERLRACEEVLARAWSGLCGSARPTDVW
jgi:trimethylamine---corrinoid protein Co-methyltransferase